MIEKAFQGVNQIAGVGWLLLIFFPRRKVTQILVHSGFLSANLSVIYIICLLLGSQQGASGDFSSLKGVQSLFQNPVVLLGMDSLPCL